MAQGAALGAATLAAGQEGGVVTREMILRAGELNRPEALVPLAGAAGDRAMRQIAEAASAGLGGSQGVGLNLAINGPILSDRVPPELLRTIWEGIQELMELGEVRPLPMEARA